MVSLCFVLFIEHIRQKSCDRRKGGDERAELISQFINIPSKNLKITATFILSLRQGHLLRRGLPPIS